MIKSKETQAVAQAYRAMYEKKVVERASWVPKEITDEGVADFMGAAANAAKAGDKEFEFGGKKYKVTMKKSTVDAITKGESVEEKTECPKCEGEGCDHCDGKGYHTENVQENMQKVAKDLEKYASQDKKGMDYDDFMKAAKLMKGNKGKELGTFTMELDTEPRDKIIDMVKNAVGKAAAEKMFNVKIREEVEESVTKDTDALEPRAEGEKKFKQMHDDNTEKTDEDENVEGDTKGMTKDVKKAAEPKPAGDAKSVPAPKEDVK